MEKELYHIKNNNCNILVYLRDKLNREGICNSIDDGGIHLSLDEKDIEYVKTLINLPIEKGMLPEVHNRISRQVMLSIGELI